MDLTKDEIGRHMKRCIELAKTGQKIANKYLTGALVLSSNGTVVGEGYNKFLDRTHYTLHADRVAIDQADTEARGGTLITTLEPCVAKPSGSDMFKPCCELIVERGIAKVIIGSYHTGYHSYKIKTNGATNYMKNHGIEVVSYRNFESFIRHELVKPNL